MDPVGLFGRVLSIGALDSSRLGGRGTRVEVMRVCQLVLKETKEAVVPEGCFRLEQIRRQRDTCGGQVGLLTCFEGEKERVLVVKDV